MTSRELSTASCGYYNRTDVGRFMRKLIAHGGRLPVWDTLRFDPESLSIARDRGLLTGKTLYFVVGKRITGIVRPELFPATGEGVV